MIADRQDIVETGEHAFVYDVFVLYWCISMDYNDVMLL